MGARPSIGSFIADDSFLRRVDRKRRIRDGIVSPEVFTDKHATLSFTYQDAALSTMGGLDRYQRQKQLPHGDLPGLCKLTYHDLTVEIEPPLPPRTDPDPDDEDYGHLHCCTDQPIDDVQRRKMAHRAEQNGIVREFVPRKRRKDAAG